MTWGIHIGMEVPKENLSVYDVFGQKRKGEPGILISEVRMSDL